MAEDDGCVGTLEPGGGSTADGWACEAWRAEARWSADGAVLVAARVLVRCPCTAQSHVAYCSHGDHDDTVRFCVLVFLLFFFSRLCRSFPNPRLELLLLVREEGASSPGVLSVAQPRQITPRCSTAQNVGAEPTDSAQFMTNTSRGGWERRSKGRAYRKSAALVVGAHTAPVLSSSRIYHKLPAQSQSPSTAPRTTTRPSPLLYRHQSPASERDMGSSWLWGKNGATRALSK